MPVSNTEALRQRLLKEYNPYNPTVFPEAENNWNPYIWKTGQFVKNLINPVNEAGLPNVDVATTLPGTTMMRGLIDRIKIGDKSATAAIKTIKKFVEEKLINPVSSETTELVPTYIAKFLRELDRNKLQKFPGHVRELQEQIVNQGIQHPAIVRYFPRDKTANLIEGNTRTAVASNLDIPAIPIRGVRSDYGFYGGPQISIPEINPFGGGRVPAEFKPSDLGFDVYDTNELIDLISKIKQSK